jgi:hypothetical protein
MSAGVDAIGVAGRVTPALIVLLVLLPAGPAMGAAAGPEPAAPLESIDPDCHPDAPEKADPEHVEQPDGICPPDTPSHPSDSPRPEQGPEPQPDPGPKQPDERPEQPDPSPQPPPGSPPEVHAQPSPGGSAGPLAPPSGARHPAGAPDSAAPKRRGRTGPPQEHARERSGAERETPAARRDRRPATKQTAERRGAGRRPPERAHRRGNVRDLLEKRLRGPSATPFPAGALEPLPDPLSRARRLDAAFATRLAHVADRFRVPWQLMLAVLRTRGHDGSVPAQRAQLRVLARRLRALGAHRNPRRAVRRLARARVFTDALEPPLMARRSRFVQRVVALAHYNRAIGLRGLVRGLTRVQKRLGRLVLRSRRIEIYSGGRADIASGVTDVRVLVLLRYLSNRYREVTVTSLTAGHSFLTASGNVSAHSYGRAVDIAALNGTPILGHQEPGGLAERALRHILLLPKGLQPSELISLFELGGPSFALADHADHIHAGY